MLASLVMRGSKKCCGSYERNRHPTRWLELVTADHLVAQNGSMEGITGDCDAIIIKDLFSKVKDLFSKVYYYQRLVL